MWETVPYGDAWLVRNTQTGDYLRGWDGRPWEMDWYQAERWRQIKDKDSAAQA